MLRQECTTKKHEQRSEQTPGNPIRCRHVKTSLVLCSNRSEVVPCIVQQIVFPLLA